MIEDLKSKEYEKVTLGVEPTETENIKIYQHLGFNEFIKSAQETYPDGTVIDVDYYGMYRGRFFAFEAKQCSRDYFEIERLKEHQISFLHSVNNQNGLAFIVFYFQLNNKIFML